MSSPIVIPQTLFGPNQPLGVPIVSSTIDLTTISSPSLQVLRPDGTTVTWIPTIVPANVAPYFQTSLTATVVMFAYSFLVADLSAGGAAWRRLWTVTPFAVLSGNPVEFNPVQFRVVDQWGRT